MEFLSRELGLTNHWQKLVKRIVAQKKCRFLCKVHKTVEYAVQLFFFCLLKVH